MKDPKQEILDAMEVIDEGHPYGHEYLFVRLRALLDTHMLIPIVKDPETIDFVDNQVSPDNTELKHMWDQEKKVALQMFDLVAHITHQQRWSQETFGPGKHTEALLLHILDEVEEIYKSPQDLEEWIDVIILALDGAWRQGHSAIAICNAIADKHRRNESRTWPDWRRQPENQPIKHLKSK